MTKKIENIIKRYAVGTLGLLCVAVGVALSIISNLGTAPLSCAAYVLDLKVASITVGTFVILVNMTMMLLQICLLRSRFKSVYLMQIVATILFGYMIDGSLWALAWLQPGTILARLSITLIAGVVTAVGVALELAGGAWMLSAEMTVQAISTVTGKNFSHMKIAMDCAMVVLAAVLSTAFWLNPFGEGALTSLYDVLLARTPGVVIGLGTLILAVLPGYLLRFIKFPPIEKVD